MDFKFFGERLVQQLQLPLPGIGAQGLMAPKPIDSRRFQESLARPAKLSAVLVLLYPFENEIHMALTKRPIYPGVHSGQISFPGGKKEPHDKDLIDTALREAEEEVGVDREDIEVIGALTDLFIIVSNFKVKPIIGLIDHKPKFILDPREVEGLLNVKLKKLNSPKNQGLKKMTFKNEITIDSPYYNVYGNVVWGATAMIISELLAVLKPILEE
jgi:8-oxo-dGTP pyrophosphatase MutT (NUDIX family)